MSEPAFSFTSDYRPRLQVGTGDVHYATGAGVWGASLWGDAGATWNGSEPIWRDVSCEALSVDCSVGRDYSVDRFTPGSATITATNVDRWATQANPDGLDVRPGRQVRVVVDRLAVPGLVPRAIFRGWIDAVTPSYSPAYTGDTVTLECIDALGEVGTYLDAALPTPVGAGEFGDARFRRILTRAQWSPQRIGDVDDSLVTMAATDMSQAIVDELGQLAESEGGAIVADNDAHLYFRARDWQTWPGDIPLTDTIGNVAPSDVNPTAIEVTRRRDDDSLATRVIIGAKDATPLVLNDSQAQALYGVQVWSRTDLLCTSAAQLRTLGNRVLATKKGGDGRLRSVSFAATTAPVPVIELALHAQLWTRPPARYLVRLNDLADGSSLVNDVFLLQGVSHRITRDEWELTLTLERAAPYTRDVARWGAGTWDESLWGKVV